MFPAFANALELKNPLAEAGVTSIPDLINGIANFIAFQIAPPIITIMVLWGAFKMLTAGGNESKFQEGKKTITYAIIGAAAVLLASGITSLIKNFLQAGVNP